MKYVFITASLLVAFHFAFAIPVAHSMYPKEVLPVFAKKGKWMYNDFYKKTEEYLEASGNLVSALNDVVDSTDEELQDAFIQSLAENGTEHTAEAFHVEVEKVDIVFESANVFLEKFSDLAQIKYPEREILSREHLEPLLEDINTNVKDITNRMAPDDLGELGPSCNEIFGDCMESAFYSYLGGIVKCYGTGLRIPVIGVGVGTACLIQNGIKYHKRQQKCRADLVKCVEAY